MATNLLGATALSLSNLPSLRSESRLYARTQLVWAALVVVVWSGLLFTLSVDPDYTAGELLDHLSAWRETGVLYRAVGPEPPWRVLNYPPLVLLMTRAIAALGVPALAAGRMVNALGLIAAVAAVTWWAHARGARGSALVGTLGLVGASFPLLYGAGQFHVELWAAAGTVWGFALLDQSTSRQRAALGGLALALACFAKQTQVIPAAIALIFVWTKRRRAAPSATAVFCAVALVGAAAVSGVHGAEAWRQIVLYTVGTFSLANLGEQTVSHLAPWSILLVFTARTMRSGSALADGAAWYWCGALAWCLSSARVGSSYAYFVDIHLATVLLAGPKIFGDVGPGSRGWAWLLAGQIVGADVCAAAILGVDLTRVVKTERELPALCQGLGDAPVLAEEAGVVRACGKPALVHPFIMTALAARGRWDPTPFERALRAGAFRLVLLPFDPREPVEGAHRDRWTPSTLTAFRSAPAIERAPTGRWLLRWEQLTAGTPGAPARTDSSASDHRMPSASRTRSRP